jgi:hypothetical protein
VGIRGRVRLEDFGVSLIIRILSYDDGFYNVIATLICQYVLLFLILVPLVTETCL